MAYQKLDPLAQSFSIDTPSVITKVDLYFSSKDSTLPVFLQIRKNVNGLPGPDIVPLTQKIIYPSEITTTSNANVATSVSFTNPVFLDTGEYSLTLGSDSNNYRVWVSELGEVDTVTSKRITDQPYVGSLYKSQNAVAYTPVQTEDLKFKMYRAKFTTNVTSSIDFLVNDTDRSKYTVKSLERDPIEVFPGSSICRIHHEKHGMDNGTYVKIDGLSNARIFGNVFNSFYNINASAFYNAVYTISNVTSDSYTIVLPNTSNATVSTRFGGVSMSATQDIRYDQIYPVISSVNKNGLITPSFRGATTSYTADSTFTQLDKNDNELTATKLITGNTTNVYNFANGTSFVYKLELTTDNQYSAPLIDKKQQGLVLSHNIINSPSYDNDNLSFDIIKVSPGNAANVYALSNTIGLLNFTSNNIIGNATSIVKGTILTISNTNPNNGIYRVLDVLDSGANVKIIKISGNVVTDANVSNLYTVTNGINFVTEEAASGGSVFSKYITRQIDFINESTSFNLRVDVAKPTDAIVEFYYKTKLVGESELLSNKEYTQLTGITVPTSLSGEFYEVEKQLDNLEAFNAINIKVVFKSTNSAQVPKIKNLRLIALQ